MVNGKWCSARVLKVLYSAVGDLSYSHPLTHQWDRYAFCYACSIQYISFAAILLLHLYSACCHLQIHFGREKGQENLLQHVYTQ